MARRSRKRTVMLPLGFVVVLAVLLIAGYGVMTYANVNPNHTRGDLIDTFNGVDVFYNGGVNQSSGRELGDDGYNIGLRWQCVEFVKRYFYEKYGHRMPDPWGHAKDFFADGLAPGVENKARGMLQFANGSISRPAVEDVVVFGPTLLNPYGHVAIVSNVSTDLIEIVQQNPGPFASSRVTLPLRQEKGMWTVDVPNLRGWLRYVATPN